MQDDAEAVDVAFLGPIFRASLTGHAQKLRSRPLQTAIKSILILLLGVAIVLESCHPKAGHLDRPATVHQAVAALQSTVGVEGTGVQKGHTLKGREDSMKGRRGYLAISCAFTKKSNIGTNLAGNRPWCPFRSFRTWAVLIISMHAMISNYKQC